MASVDAMDAMKRQCLLQIVRSFRTTCQRKNVIKPTYANCIMSWNSGSNLNMNSPSIPAAKIPQNNAELVKVTPVSLSRRTRMKKEDATLIKFPICLTRRTRDPIADPEAGHMSHFC